MSHQFIITSLVTFALLSITACNNTSTPVSNTTTSMTLSKLAKTFKTKSSCLANNGKWEKVGKLQIPKCVLTSKDAGKTCTDAKQCEIKCITKVRNIKPNDKAVGKCASSTNISGCRTPITNGLAGRTLCID